MLKDMLHQDNVESFVGVRNAIQTANFRYKPLFTASVYCVLSDIDSVSAEPHILGCLERVTKRAAYIQQRTDCRIF